MASEVKKKIVDTTTSELTKSAILWLQPLVLGLVLALVPLVRDRILPVLPKPLLMVIVGISLSLNLALFFYILRHRSKLKKVKTELEEAQAKSVQLQDLIDNPPRKFMFGVNWDKDGIPYCTVHNYPLSDVIRLHRNRLIPAFVCPGEHVITLRNDEGKLLSPVEAKQRMLCAAPETENQSHKEHPDQNPDDVDPDEPLEKTLALLTSFRDNLPKNEMDVNDMREYHSLLDAAENELRYDLSEFRITQSAIKSREIPQSFGYDISGNISGDPYRVERYILPSTFQRKLDALINFLNGKQ